MESPIFTFTFRDSWRSYAPDMDERSARIIMEIAAGEHQQSSASDNCAVYGNLHWNDQSYLSQCPLPAQHRDAFLAPDPSAWTVASAGFDSIILYGGPLGCALIVYIFREPPLPDRPYPVLIQFFQHPFCDWAFTLPPA